MPLSSQPVATWKNNLKSNRDVICATFASRFILDLCLCFLVLAKTDQTVISGDLICMVDDVNVPHVKFAASTRRTEPGQPRTSVSVLPAVRSRTLATGYWQFSLFSVISDSD